MNGLPEIAAVSPWLAQGLIQNLHALALVVSGLLITVSAVQNLTYTLQLFLAGYGLARRPLVESVDTLWWYYSDVILPVSLLIPAYNEQSCIVESVSSLLRLRYPLFEVIVINDGSRDATLDRLIEALHLELSERIYENALPHAPVRGIYTSPAHPNLIVLDKENGGKADALNAGINVARRPLIASLDADSMLEPDSLLRVVQPFISHPERMIAVGGTVRVINGCTVREGRIVDVGLPRSLLAQLQIIEYLRAFLMGRLGWSELKALPLVAGAFAVMRRAAVIEAGGYDRDTVGEDFELIMRLHRLMRDKGEDYEIRFVPEPVCWTEVPSDMCSLARQRIRWQRGALETFCRHADMLFRRRYGRIGALSLGHCLIVDVVGPVAEVVGYVLIPLFWVTGLLDLDFTLAFLALIFVYGIFISVGSLVLEELELKRFEKTHHLLFLAFVAIFENFGYRQMNNLFRIIGCWQFLRGKKGSWGEMRRAGFTSAR